MGNKCEKCGNVLQEDSLFCNKCGKKIKATKAAKERKPFKYFDVYVVAICLLLIVDVVVDVLMSGFDYRSSDVEDLLLLSIPLLKIVAFMGVIRLKTWALYFICLFFAIEFVYYLYIDEMNILLFILQTSLVGLSFKVSYDLKDYLNYKVSKELS